MIVISPHSNDALRDWPRHHYAELIDLCLAHLNNELVLIGSADQRQAINLLVRGRPAGRLSNMAGEWSWAETATRLASAELIVANNSGIAHLGASLGRPTICLFTASHDPHEWGPRGPKVLTLYSKTACSPCAMSTHRGCDFGQLCMTQLQPPTVFKAIQRMLARG